MDKRYFPYILLSILTIPFFVNPISVDTDLWFHMKAGEEILSSRHFIYHDPFSFTAGGREWLYHEWLFGLISFLIYSISGFTGIVISKIVILWLTFIVIYRIMAMRGSGAAASVSVIFMAVLGARFRFAERPEIYVYLLTVIYLYILESHRLKRGNYLAILPVLQVIWTNLHGSFVIGPVMIFAYMAGVMIEKRSWRGVYPLYILPAAILATLINPYGLELVLFPLKFGDNPVLQSLTEWKPTRFENFLGPFGILFTAGWVFFLLSIYRLIRGDDKGRETSRECAQVAKGGEITDFFILLIFSYLALKAIRFTAIFCIAASPVISAYLSMFLNRETGGLLGRWIIAASALVIIPWFAVQEVRSGAFLDMELEKRLPFSPGAVNFIKENQIPGRMYNSYLLGGYLIWSFCPEKKVFVDGRAEIYDRGFQYAFIIGASREKLLEYIERYDINMAVISTASSYINPRDKWIINNPEWSLLYWDEKTLVYVRKKDKNRGLIERFGHAIFTDPLNMDMNVVNAAMEGARIKDLESELIRDISLVPDNSSALYWLGIVYNETGRGDEAVDVWQRSAAVSPKADTFARIGNIYYEKGRSTEAIEYYLKAISEDKRFSIAYIPLGLAYEATGRKKEAVEAYKSFLKYDDGSDRDITVKVKMKLSGFEGG